MTTGAAGRTQPVPAAGGSVSAATTAASLAPLEHVLLGRAEASADALRTAAEREARAATDAARRDAAAILARARSEGDADAAQRQAEDRARARRDARGIVLAAQRAVHDELRTSARAAVAELLADPRRDRRLVALVRERLGPDAQVRPHPSGGVVGRTPDGRRVDASVDALVEQALAAIDLAPLWTVR